MENSDIHFSIEIPTEIDEIETQEVDTPSDLPNPLTLGAKIVGGTVSLVGKVLGGIYQAIKPTASPSEEGSE